ncbi:EAF6 [Candida pseudojiufengensis]|uniref:EAF6 n=1 Tax=Candida pseudojiufengensis TaxID=497109 RepID=UPI0022254AC9|nr:EAF6 [Candida pseudojiufengensis]KAI5964835.1 EAF6 [Candida pseudojiufengensis]
MGNDETKNSKESKKQDAIGNIESKKSVSSESKSPSKSDNKAGSNSNNNNSHKSSTTSNHKSSKASVEKYNDLKKKLTQQILKKQEITQKLQKLEESIYQKESDYFEESTIGNIVKGFENYSKLSGGSSLATTGLMGNKRRIVYTEDDHIFSLSSVKFIKNLHKKNGGTTAYSIVNGNGYLENGNSNNGSADTSLNNTLQTIINSKDDYEEYEDSVDPSGANSGIKITLPPHDSRSDSASSTPSRKRKARTIEDC